MESHRNAEPLSEYINLKASDSVPLSVSTIEIGSSTASSASSVDGVEGSENTAFTRPSQEHIASSSELDTRTALEILQIIETYGSHYKGVGGQWRGLTDYVAIVMEQVRANEPIRLLFSGLDLKSTSALGELPDLGEKLALAHLNGLCSNISAIYSKGAEVHICLRGFLFNDLMGIPDDTVWNYEEGLLKIASSSELQHVRFLQLGETLHQDSSIWTKAHTLASIGDLREELVSRKACSSLEAGQVALPSYLVRSLSSLDDKERLKLLELARARCLAYNAVLLAAKPGSIRLEAASRSVNDPQQDDVLIVSLLPQGEADETSTPSDSVISIETNGRYRCTDLSQVKDRSEYELILDASGAPSHYRAKASIWDWTDDGLDVTFEHLYPTGTMIRPSSSYAENTPSIKTLPMRKIRTLAHTFSPVVLRGFSETTDEEYFLAKGEEMGEIMTWDFGKICKVKDSGEVDKNANNVTTNEALPMHFDGVFKFADTVDPVSGEVKKVMTPPGYQYFTCLSTAPKGDGYTLFANSRLFFQSLPAPFTLERLEKTTWSMVNDGFWTAKQTELPLVEPHKETGAPCLRWHQPWTDTKYSKFYVEIEDDEAGEELNVVIEKLIYDYRVCLRFEWEAGDLLISDNMSMMHTRTGFAGACEREMWRIHFD